MILKDCRFFASTFIKLQTSGSVDGTEKTRFLAQNDELYIKTMHKIPEITLCFWIMKISATTLGETAGDLMSMTLNIGYAVSSMILIGVFVIALVLQLLSKTYNPLLYWSVILLTSTAGTTMSDYMDRTLKLGYTKGALILFTILMMIFGLWRLMRCSFAVEKIATFKAECLFWTAILFSNTLGTALGDFLADDSGLGFRESALLIASLLALIALSKFFTRISSTFLFWAAFVLTRPFGATMGDSLTKSPAQGGLGFGTMGSSAVLAAILLIFIYFQYREINKKGQPIKAGR